MKHFRALEQLPRIARQLVLFTAPLLIAAMTAPAYAQSGTSGMTGNARGNQGMASDSTQSLVNLLYVANKDEIEANRYAHTRLKRAELKTYAQTLVDEHAKALKQLDDSASTGSWTKADSMNWTGGRGAGGAELADHAREIHAGNMAAMQKLRAASDDLFERTYLSTQIEGHETLLKKLSGHRTSNPKLDKMLSSMKTSVQKHLEEARRLQSADTK